MKKGLKFTKEQLEELYLIRKLSLSRIGNQFNCNGSNIFYWLKKFGIERRPVNHRKIDIPKNVLEDLCHLLDCNENQIPGRACELFTKWKKVVKKKKEIDSKDLCSIEVFEGDVLVKVCEVLKTQPEHVIKTVKRFKKELGN